METPVSADRSIDIGRATRSAVAAQNAVILAKLIMISSVPEWNGAGNLPQRRAAEYTF
jgi:hypothetical protein